MGQSGTSGSFGLQRLWKVRRLVSRWFDEQKDLLPPYHIYQGHDWGKRSEAGKFYLELGSDSVEVDGVIYRLLGLGETIRVRYTRRMRAINLDRFVGDETGIWSNE